MATDQRVDHGVEVEQLEEFAEFAAKNPDRVQLGLGARSTYEGKAAHSHAR